MRGWPGVRRALQTKLVDLLANRLKNHLFDALFAPRFQYWQVGSQRPPSWAPQASAVSLGENVQIKHFKGPKRNIDLKMKELNNIGEQMS
jgi:hypothetical protein